MLQMMGGVPKTTGQVDSLTNQALPQDTTK